MIALAILAGLLIAGVAVGAFEFDGLLNDVGSGGSQSDPDQGDTVEGSLGNDLVQSGDLNDDINTDSGNDTIDSQGGDDRVLAGDGADSVSGGSGDDTILGEAGNDTINADQGLDIVYGGSGADYVDGGSGDDTILGQSGDDSILGRTGSDFVDGGTGDDTIKGGAGDDLLVGYLDSTFDNSFETSDIYDPDSILGGAGSDVILAGSGDTIIGGDGADYFTLGSWIDPANPVYVEDFAPTEDIIAVVVPTTYSGAGVISVDQYQGASYAGTIYLDGTRVAEVTGGTSTIPLTASMVTVVYQDNFV